MKPVCGELQKCVDQGGQAVCKGDKGASCQSCGDCAPGLVCSSGTCQDPCVFDPRAPGCAPAHCSNGVKDGTESDVDCGGDCPACNTGGGCNSDADCGSDSTCGENNGACFEFARAKRVCWPATCKDGGNTSACGEATSACGKNCACVTPCDAKDPNSVCPSGEVCKPGMGVLFSAPSPDVCVSIDPPCPSNDPALCGSTFSLCGPNCICTPNCSSATCANPADGCGGECPGVCKDGQTGCKHDLHCPSGFTCLGSADGTTTCRPGFCAFRVLAPPLCGQAGAPCGEQCPACTPRCENRECGPDPNCGQSCGTCGAGTSCNIAGKCVAPTTPDPPVTVPTGDGNRRILGDIHVPPPSPVGALKGQFSVSEQGTAEFNVPIEVPPGRAGIEPALVLKYAGSRANENLGVGWRLEGLSKITRCPRAYALDKYTGPIRNDPSDRFCIDGKRLENVKGVSSGTVGVYGANGTEYRTLIDSFARIISYQDAGSGIQLDTWQGVPFAPPDQRGPDYFRVFTNDHRILTFGRSRDSLVLGRSGIRYAWLLNRVEDRLGNTMTISYTNLSASIPAILSAGMPNLVRPSEIAYTGHIGATSEDHGNRAVRFSYETRADPQLTFLQGGVPFSVTDRLTRITTYVNHNEPVKNYKLEYGPGVVSQVEKIFECAGGDDAICKPPTRFDYQKESGFTDRQTGLDIATAAQLDANGDGIPDFLALDVHLGATDAKPWVAGVQVASDIAVGVGSAVLIANPAVGIAVNVVWSVIKGPIFGLFADDPDVTMVPKMLLGTGKRAEPTNKVDNVSGLPCNGFTPLFVLDYNRDGKDDLLSGCPDAGTIVASLSDGNGSFASTQVLRVPIGKIVQTSKRIGGDFTEEFPGPAPVVFDVDGDSLQDIISCKDEFTLELRRRKGPGEGFDDPIQFIVPPTPTPRVPHALCAASRPTYHTFDVDGDGTPNLLVHGDTWKVLRYFVSGGVPKLEWQAVDLPDVGQSAKGSLGGAKGKGPLSLGDFNGDGLSDIWATDGNQAVIWINSGDGRFWTKQLTRPQVEAPFAYVRTGVVDFNADGRTDLLEEWEDRTLRRHVALVPDGQLTILASSSVTLKWPDDFPGLFVEGQFLKAGDVDGDGNIDLFGNGRGVFYGTGTHNTLLTRVVDGLGNVVKIEYDRKGSGPIIIGSDTTTTYLTDDRCKGATWPEMCLKRMSGLVGGHTEGFVDAGGHDVDERRYGYQYFNARMNVTGEGFLGFDRRILSAPDRTTTIDYEPVARYDLQSLPTTSTTPPYVYPLAGLPKVITVDQAAPLDDGSPLESALFTRRTRVENHWRVQLSAFDRPFPFVGSRLTSTFDREQPAVGSPPSSFDQNGTLLTDCFASFSPDGYGNVLLFEERCQESFQLFVERTFTTTTVVPDPSTWLISNPKHISTISSRGTSAAEEWDFTYSSQGLLHTITRASGKSEQQHKTTYVRDDFGNVSQVIEEVTSGEPARSTSMTYDADNIFPKAITNAKDQTTEMRFDARWGTPKTIADPNGIAVQRGYDGFGRLVETRGPEGTTIATYANIVAPLFDTAAGHVEPRIQVSVERQGTEGTRSGSSVSELDNYGRLVRSRTEGFGGMGVIDEQVYDVLGRLSGKTLPHTADATVVPTVKYSYDHLHRVREIQHSDGKSKKYQYASHASLAPPFAHWLNGMSCGGLPVSSCAVGVTLTIDEEGRKNVVITDHRGLVVRSIDGENIDNTEHSSNYKYGAFNRLIEARDNQDDLTSFIYDDYGRRQRLTDPDTGSSSFMGYNGYDELVTSTDPKGQLRTYHHDELGRMDSIVDPAGTTQWIYDQGTNGLGRLSESISPATSQNPSGQHVHYTYEPPTPTNNRSLVGRVDYTIDGTQYTVGFDYDDLGRTERIHYPTLGSGPPIVAKYSYSTSGILQNVDETGSGVTKPIWRMDEAFQAHLVQRETFGNGASTSYGYHEQRRWLQSIQTTLGSGPIQSFEHDHLNNGLLHTRTTSTGTREYTYDNLNRLSSTLDSLPAGSTQSTVYGYDSIGNITGRGPTVIKYLPDQPHLIDAAGPNAYHYDLNGNVDERSGPDIPGGVQQIDYTPFDLPSVIRTGSGTNAKATSFEYTADEARAVRRDPDTTRHFVTELYERLLAASGDTLEERFRLYGGGRQLGEIVRKNGADRTLYFHADILGSVDTVSDNNQASFQQEFDPFGLPIDPPNPEITRAGFTGHEHDRDLGLIDMKGRIYDPLAARFTSADPFMQAPFWSQGLNRYSYVFNDPANHVDPSGFDAADIVGAAVWAGHVASAGLIAYGFGAGLGSIVGAGAASAGNLETTAALGFGIPGTAAKDTAVTPSATPTTAAEGQGSMNATAQNRSACLGGCVPSSFDQMRAARAQAKQRNLAASNVLNDRIGDLPVDIIGGTPEERRTIDQAVNNILTKSARGRVIRARLESRHVGWLTGGGVKPLEVGIGHWGGSNAPLGGSFTPDVGKGALEIDLDQYGDTYIAGNELAGYSNERLVAHELGHAFGTYDEGGLPNPWMRNVLENENPIMRELGDLRDRTSYFPP